MRVYRIVAAPMVDVGKKCACRPGSIFMCGPESVDGFEIIFFHSTQ